MSQQIDISSANDWANFLIGLLDKGEWKTLLFTLVVTFSLTYILKLFYFGFVPKNSGTPFHIRILAVVSGFIAAALVWNSNAISMQWYTAGIMVGPLSIALHHVLEGVSKMKVVKAIVPWLYPLIKGQKDKRVGARRGVEARR
ncbi:hypothetical protein KAR91_48070 [Candidatus Pacearchaeota archaeon]|nr:hypothetical protein [Candidatus Pacearchaeota archaeon]